MKEDYANLDGRKVKRIMQACLSIYNQYPSGIILTGGGLMKGDYK